MSCSYNKEIKEWCYLMILPTDLPDVQFLGSTTAYTLLDSPSKVSPCMVHVHPLLILFLTFFKVNLTITLGWVSLITMTPKFSK